MQCPSPTWFRVLAQELKALHEIPHIIGAINKSHIPILTPVIRKED
jgi:hypothetical protein